MGYIFFSIPDFPGNDNSPDGDKMTNVFIEEQEMFGYSRYPCYLFQELVVQLAARILESLRISDSM